VRTLFAIHRYLGIVVGLLMVMWCVSGIVMMYVPYPQLSEAARVEHLRPLDWQRCCSTAGLAVPGDVAAEKAQLEMLGTTLVLRWREADRRWRMTDAATGRPIGGISQAQARNVAQAYGDPGIQPRLLGLIDHDQWTIQGAGGQDRPLFQFSLGDPRGTELYVSSVTGKAIQITTSRERFWNWLGAVPHWIYFSRLRQHPELWSSVVVWTSTIGCFLTITGLCIGIRQLRPRAHGGRLPYRGLQYWHHLLGLIFGLFLLTWVASGLVSMNPWGFLDGGPATAELARLRGAPIKFSQLGASLVALAQSPERRAVASVETAPLHGELFLIASDDQGVRRRLDAQGLRAALALPEFDYITTQLAQARPVLSRGLMTAEDLYYFSHHREIAQLPAYRIVLNDADRTRYYVDAVTGEMTMRIDPAARWYRWLHQALHRLDVNAAFRGSVARDLLMLTLLTGMSGLSTIGAYIGFRRVLRDLWGARG
jgi:uncharacterized iron-regulated membrane protein